MFLFDSCSVRSALLEFFFNLLFCFFLGSKEQEENHGKEDWSASEACEVAEGENDQRAHA